MDIFIHVGGLELYQTLSSKLKAPSLGFTLMHKPSSFHNALLLQLSYQSSYSSNMKLNVEKKIKNVSNKIIVRKKP
jgi:hypothetical protein